MSAANPAGFGRLLASEMRLIFSRRRNQFGLGVLAAVPLIMAISMRLEGGVMSGLLAGNGLVVPFTALMASAPFFLPMAVSMLAGGAIAGEANQGTLRYLLTVPAGRTRLLLVKLCSLLISCLVGAGLIGLVGSVAGVGLLGGGLSISMSGTQLGFGAALGRIALMYLYCAAMMAALAALGLFISTLTDQPLGATVAIMTLNILSWIAMAVEQLDWLHPFLLSTWMTSFADLLSDPMLTSNIANGLWLALGYLVVFSLAAWAKFTHKDITS